MTLLNLRKTDRVRYIYRIMRPEYVYDLFKTKTNVLVTPRRWQDPFENFILQSPARLSTGEVVTFGFHDHFHGQCWTLNQASDAMWRIYSPELNGIRVRTTIGGLVDGLTAALATSAPYKAHIGKVLYKSTKQLKAICRQGIELTSDATGIAKTLLLKRIAFRHEKEIRLLYFADENEITKDGLLRYQVDPTVMVEQLMVDPRLGKAEAQTFIEKIRRDTGFSGPIKRSLLYAPPEGFETRIKP